MKERDDKRGGFGCAIGIVLAILLLPVLYVLGIGPAGRLVNDGYLSQGTLDYLFYPVFCVTARWPWAAGALVWYGRLWGA